MRITIGRGIFFLILLFAISTARAQTLELERQFTYDDEIFGYFSSAIIDKDNHIIGGFYNTPRRLFTPEQSVPFAELGQGPNQLTGLWATGTYNDDLAFVEMPNKIKIFTKKDGKYVWKETKWFKRGPYLHAVRGIAFLENKWFFAGINYIDMKKNDFKISFVKVYDSEGNPLKELLEREVKDNETEALPYMQMTHFIFDYKDRLFYLPENELKVTVIDPKELKVLKEISLEIPACYKPMPPGLYTFKKRDGGENRELDLYEWKSSYSRIMKVQCDGDYLVLQFRVFDKESKKFALLFYNADTFKLEKTLFIDDCFMGARDGKYYFYAGGDPGIDEEDADKCIINVYGLKGKK